MTSTTSWSKQASPATEGEETHRPGKGCAEDSRRVLTPSILIVLVLATLGTILILGVVCVSGGSASASAPSNGRRQWVRGISGVFALQFCYALILGILIFTYFADRTLIPLPDLLGVIPIGVPFFGALGAITISMSALADHRDDWEPEWWYWHASRPIVGAIVGTVSVVFFVVGILSVGQKAPTASAGPNLLYYAIAFVVGYREQAFRDLVKRVVDLLLKPGSQSALPQIQQLNPPTGSATGGTQVTLTGTGLAGVSNVTFGGAKATPVSVSDTAVVVNTPPGEVGPAAVSVRTQGGCVRGPDCTH